MKKFQELLDEMARLKRKWIALWVFAGLALLGVATVAAVSASIQVGPTMATGAVIAMLALGLITIVLASLGAKANAKSSNLCESLIELPFYRIGDNYYTFDGPIGGVLEQLDSSLVAARIAANEHYKTIPFPDQTSIEIYPGGSPDDGCITLGLTRYGSLQNAFDAFGVEGLHNYPLSARISEALGPLLPLIGRLDNGFLGDREAEILTIELCRQLGELGPDVLGPYEITGVHQTDRSVLPDDQHELWKKLKANSALPILCQHQVRTLSGCGCRLNSDVKGGEWRTFPCRGEELYCPDYQALSPPQGE